MQCFPSQVGDQTQCLSIARYVLYHRINSSPGSVSDRTEGENRCLCKEAL